MYGQIVGHISVEMGRSVEYHCCGLQILVSFSSFLLAQKIYTKLKVINRNVIVLAIRRALAMLIELKERSGIYSSYAGHIFAEYCL